MPLNPARRALPSPLAHLFTSGAVIDEDGNAQPVNPEHRLSPYWYQQRTPRNAENSQYFQPPHPYELSGEVPDPAHRDVAAVLVAARAHSYTPKMLSGLVLEMEGPHGRWFVSFNPQDMYHEEHWFHEASGHGWVFNASVARSPLTALWDFLDYLNGHLPALPDPPQHRSWT
jgi:hypothetical protein